MILFFHFICLLARYVVSNISKSLNKGRVHNKGGNADDCTGSQWYVSVRGKANYTKYSVYEGDTLKFFPPVYVQRYETVALILEDAAQKLKIKKVVDFGCAELGFLMYLKNIAGITEILEVDIDLGILERHSSKAAPLSTDYLMGKRKTPLDIYILAGSVEDYDDHLAGVDALVAIELIEHLSEEAFAKMPFNVFCKIKPKIAVFTTPNADFNSLFPNFTNLRHEDHKFEWTRKEFYQWTQKVLSICPDYSVRFYGIGEGPEGTENLGCCSQMAVFERYDDAEYFVSARDDTEDNHTYKLIEHYKYPFNIDSRTVEEKIFHEVQYQAAYLNTLETFYNYEKNESEIPLNLLKQYVSDLCCNDEELVSILKNNGMTLRQNNSDWFLIYTEPESSLSDTTSRCGEWLNEEFSESFYDRNDLIFSDGGLYDDEEDLCLDSATNFLPSKNFHQLNEFLTCREGVLDEDLLSCRSRSKEKINSAPQSSNELSKQDPLKTSCPKVKKEQNKKLVQSRIPRIKSDRYESSFVKNVEVSYPYATKTFKKISKSCSLDSCLENINCSPFTSDLLSLFPRGSTSFNDGSSFNPSKREYFKNYSGSSLLNSSIGKAGDSGCPFSFSPPNDNLTPEQVDELYTDSEVSRSTSSSSAAVVINDIEHGLLPRIFDEDLAVENGDLANNNRDGEGNNVEGLIGPILVNEIAAERDPNDNLFFPEPAEFPPWLLHLGELALRPVYAPLLDSDNDEGVGDDSSSNFNRSIDLEDFDIDF